MTSVALAIEPAPARPRAPVWFSRLRSTLRSRLHGRSGVIHEQLQDVLSYRRISVESHGVRALTIRLDPDSGTVAVIRDGELHPSLVVEPSILERLLLALGDHPALVDDIVDHIEA